MCWNMIKIITYVIPVYLYISMVVGQINSVYEMPKIKFLLPGGFKNYTDVTNISGFLIYKSIPPTLRATTNSWNRARIIRVMAPKGYHIALYAIDFGLDGPSNVGEEGDGLSPIESDEFLILSQNREDDFVKMQPFNAVVLRGARPPHTYITNSSNKNGLNLKLILSNVQREPIRDRGFVLQWTRYRKRLPGKICNPDSEFECPNLNMDNFTSWCIPIQLACDAVQHCPDGSDLEPRKQGVAGCSNIANTDDEVGFGVILAICIGIIIFCAFFIAIACICTKRLNDQSRTPVHLRSSNSSSKQTFGQMRNTPPPLLPATTNYSSSNSASTRRS